jgi:hypothetical protein
VEGSSAAQYRDVARDEVTRGVAGKAGGRGDAR